MTATSQIAPRQGAGELTVCGLCGHSYGRSAHSGCASCPLNDGCLMTCCPNCGYSAPDPRNSKLLAAARALGGLARRGRRLEAQ